MRIHNIIMIMLIMVMGFASAEVQSLPTQKLNQCVTLEQTCASCTYVNLDSVKYPNSSMEYLNTLMDASGNKYTYNFCNTSQTGIYIVTTCGDVDGTETCVDYDFEVTRDGTEQEGTQTIGKIIAWLFGYVFVYLVFVKFNKVPLYKFIGTALLVSNSIIGILILESIIPFVMLGATMIMMINNLWIWFTNEGFK